MKKLSALFISTVSVVLFISSNTYAASGQDYWPNWRGPDNTGASKTANPPVTWSETENIKWKVPVPGEGLSTPIVWENKVIFLAAIETDTKGSGSINEYKFDVVCLDRETGKTLWQKTPIQTAPHEGHQQTGSFASSSAVTDGNHIWAGFGSRGVYCYDMDGNKIWDKDLGKMRMARGFGEGSSVALAGNAIIVQMDQEDQSKIYALNKDTGDIIWQKDRDEVTSWATPLPVEYDGKFQVVIGKRRTQKDQVKTDPFFYDELIAQLESETVQTNSGVQVRIGNICAFRLYSDFIASENVIGSKIWGKINTSWRCILIFTSQVEPVIKGN